MSHYLAFGTPYLACRFPGCEDLFTDCKHAVFFDSIEDLDHKIEFYTSHPDEAEAIGKAGQDLMLNTYNTRAMVSMMLDVLKTGKSSAFPWVEVIA